ncbi:YueI family protein [Gracilibacillus sp. YIM 98692]|uniref:YueI family protein n=1 Tax=Gracilibacillus sp. YIM 98692 TaxID=2663532 RepID=UPI0013D52A44|nr:YueI family protein [Gracilibacillus sp. YIM 98692]
MAKKQLDDYIQEGIYGAKETNPDERRRYLGSLRERVVLALKKTEIRGKKGLYELEEAMRQYPDATMLMNGNMSVRFFKPYRDAAKKHHISYTSVTNRDAKTTYGIILAMDNAIDKKNIHIKHETQRKRKDKKSWWQKLFGL